MTSQNTVIPTAGFTCSPDSGLAIEASNVNKIYYAGGRAHHALKSIDIEVPIGCIFGFWGRMALANRPLSISWPEQW